MVQAERLIAAVASWAAAQDGVRAAALCGSHARGNAGPESDLDLVLICTEPERLLADLCWIHKFGSVASNTIEDHGLVRSVRVRYEDGSEVEFGITTLAWIGLLLDAGTARVMREGLRILYDPMAQVARAHAIATQSC